MNSYSNSKTQLWGGRVVSALPVLGLVLSATMKLSHNTQMMAELVGKFGYPEYIMGPLGIIELICAIIYAIPRTTVLGDVLLTGYLGGAIATHVRIGDPYIVPLILGILAWVGLFLRDERSPFTPTVTQAKSRLIKVAIYEVATLP